MTCLLTQMNYLNKSLDLFNTAIVSPIYYVMFTLLTIIASVIMFQVRIAAGMGFFCGLPGGADSHRLATHSAIRQSRRPGARGKVSPARYA
jgi:hypothetical protein